MLFRWDKFTKTSHVGEYGLYTGARRRLDEIDKVVFIAEWTGIVLVVAAELCHVMCN